jgi:thioredoxin-like negative regulator of GroEL
MSLVERRDIEASIARESTDASNYVRLGMLLVAAFHESDTAKQALERAIALDPRNVDARFWLAKVHYHDTALWEVAVELLDDALLRDANRADCLDLRGASKRSLECWKTITHGNHGDEHGLGAARQRLRRSGRVLC